MIRSALATVRGSLFARDAGALWIAELFGLGIGLIQAVFVARILGPQGYGVAALIVTVPTFIFTLIDPQSQEAVVKYLGEARREAEPARGLAVVKLAYVADLLLALAGVVLTTALAIPAARLVVGDASTTPLILAYAVLLVAGAPSATSRAVLVSFGRFSQAAIAQAAVSIVRGVVVVLAARAGGIAGVVLASGAALVIDAAVGMALAHRALLRDLAGRWLGAPLSALGSERRPILRFMVFTELSSLASVFVKQADTLVLGALGGATQVGYYRLARTTGTLVGSLILPLQTASYPRFVREAGGGERAVATVARRALLFVGLPLAVLTLAVTPLLPPAIELLAGAAYLPAATTAQVFLAGSAVTLAFFWVRPATLSIGRVRFLFVVSTMTVIVALAGFLLVADDHGALGVALVRTVVVGIAGNLAAATYLWWKARGQRAPSAT